MLVLVLLFVIVMCAVLQAALRGAQYHGGPFDDSHQLYVPPQSDAGLADASVPLSLLV